jgi:hypothetical protein
MRVLYLGEMWRWWYVPSHACGMVTTPLQLQNGRKLMLGYGVEAATEDWRWTIQWASKWASSWML